MIEAALTFVPPFLVGFLLVVLLFQEKIFQHLVLKLALAIGIGSGISSCLYFFWSLAFNPSQKAYFLLEAALIVVLIFFMVRQRVILFSRPSQPAQKSTRLQQVLFWASALVLLALLAVLALDFYYVSTMNPHGNYDAYTIWNYRARMISRGGAYWLESFTAQVWHSDYPLLLPLSTARSWLLLGRDTPQVPSFQAGLFAMGLAALLFGALKSLRDYSQAFAASLLLLGTARFFEVSLTQLADTPMAYFMLGFITLAVLFVRSSPKQPGLLILAGLLAGFAAWTKNEGNLVLVFSILCLAALRFRSPWKDVLRYSLYFVIGAALPLAALITFKTRIAPPPSDILSFSDPAVILNQIGDINRYFLIARTLVLGLWSFVIWQIPALLLMAVYAVLLNPVRQRQQWGEASIPLLFAVLMICGYFLVYLTASSDLYWYLMTSHIRLLWQVFPTLLFALFLLANSPQQVFFKQQNLAQDVK